MATIELRDISFTYTNTERASISEVSFAVQRGELCALVGRNGAGKTTLCNIIRGFIPRFHTGDLHGAVLIDGEDVSEHDLGALGSRIGFVFQNPFVQISGAKDSVYEEVAFGLENLGVPVEEIRRRVEETLDLINIDYLRDKNPHELSGGQKQRVAFASTLAMDPPIFVIDEPTSQLDPQGTEQIFEIIATLKERGKTIVLVEHKMELVAEFADSIVVLDEGRVVMHGSPSEVFASSALAGNEVAYPLFAEAGLALRADGASVPSIPVTKSQALEAFSALAATRTESAS